MLRTATIALLVAMFMTTSGCGEPTAELYDPAAGSFSTTGVMETRRAGPSATLLLNGKVLVAGGGSFSPLATAELYK